VDRELIKILLVDEHPDSLIFIRDLLHVHRRGLFEVEWGESFDASLQRVREGKHDVCLVDYGLGEKNGVDFIKEATHIGAKMPMIILTRTDDYAVDIQAMKVGAADYLLKSHLDADRLERSVRYAVKNARGLEVLREAERKFRSVVESADSGIVSADGAGNIIYANKNAYRIFGYDPGDLLGKPLVQLLPERHRADHQKRLERLQVGVPASAPFQIPGVKKDGQEFPTEVSLAAWNTLEGRYVSQIVRDITNRKAAEEKIRFQADILTQVNEAIYAVDLREEVTYWNPAAERLLGIENMEAQGRRVEALFDVRWAKPEDEKEFLGTLTKTGACQGEFAIVKKNRQEIFVEASVSQLKTESGVATGTLYVLRDVSARKQYQSIAIHSEKLAAMGQMAAGMVHELKTPLGVIRGYAELLLDGLQKKEDMTEQLAPFLEKIRQQTFRCANLVGSLLDFSRKEGTGDKEFELNEAVGAALAMIKVGALERMIEVRKQTTPEPLHIRGRKDQIEQVIINLCNNAIDAMSAHGTLTIATKPVTSEGKTYAQIQVADTGVGMSEEEQKKIFEPFFTTKEAGKGTGLGLWLCQQIITNQNGRIRCQSTPGQGTVFTVTLPLS